jgi:ubiquinone biosynthesis protein
MLADAREGIGSFISLARQGPEIAQRAERLSRELDAMAEHGLRFDAATAEAIGKAEASHSRSGRLALWLIALALIWIAWKLA